MSSPILATKLYIPPIRANAVRRPRLSRLLDEGTQGKLTLVSAAAGYGKTSLLSEWCAASESPVAWLSLDEGDSDAVRFLTYLISAIETIEPGLGESALGLLQSPHLRQAAGQSSYGGSGARS